MADLADIIAAVADDTEAQRAAVRAELERIAPDRPNAFDAESAADLFDALAREHYSEGWDA